MTITVFWDSETKTLLRIDFEGQWSWAQYDKAIDEASTLIRTAQHSVGMIFNLVRGPEMPPEVASSHLLRSLKLVPNTAAWLFIVGANPSAESLFMAFFRPALRLSGRKLTSLSRLEGVYALVAAQRR